MAIYPIVFIPEKVLRTKAADVSQYDDDLIRLVNDMYETMDHAHGIGLAAPQIGISKRIAVIDVSEKRNERFCIINPEIIATEGAVKLQEGCLSVPGFYSLAPRAKSVVVKAFNEFGQPIEIAADGLLAHCLQHEIDHLNGRVFVDYLSSLKNKYAQTKVNKHIRFNPRSNHVVNTKKDELANGQKNEDAIDESLEESFPASDPPSITPPKKKEDQKK